MFFVTWWAVARDREVLQCKTLAFPGRGQEPERGLRLAARCFHKFNALNIHTCVLCVPCGVWCVVCGVLVDIDLRQLCSVERIVYAISTCEFIHTRVRLSGRTTSDERRPRCVYVMCLSYLWQQCDSIAHYGDYVCKLMASTYPSARAEVRAVM